jgi:hypothetical protein
MKNPDRPVPTHPTLMRMNDAPDGARFVSVRRNQSV